MQIGRVLPRGAGRLARMGPVLSLEACRRLKGMQYYEEHRRNARLTCRHFDISPQTFYRWWGRFERDGPVALEARSRRLCLANTPSAALEPRIGGPPIAIAQVRLHLPPMLLLLKLIVWAVRALALSRRALVLDNLALRHQLATLAHCGRRPRLGPADRLFWVALRAVWSDWTKPLAIVKPATVVAWHRRAYRTYWRRISRNPGRPRTDAQLRDLIRRMVTENRWGAPRIHDELLKLGFRVSERTVSRYVRASRPRRPPGASWKTFLDNHRERLLIFSQVAVG